MSHSLQNPANALSERPRVALVGAGPGEPSYLTLRGAELLRRADVVLYDYLVNPRVLEHVSSHTEVHCLGRHGRSPLWSQEEIHAKMISAARSGRRVVRLKSGDPMIFGRASEELGALREAGIEYEIVPGISAGIAAGSCAGMMLTHRDFASATAFVTGSEDAEKAESTLDFRALAAFPGTLVFYMGVTTVRRWTAELLVAGKPGDTPAAVIRRCSLPDQTVIRCRLDELADRMTVPVKMRPPVIAIVGEAARDSEWFSWFERRPLFGRRVLVTRAADQNDDLESLLSELGAEVLRQPAIAVEPPSDRSEITRITAGLCEFDWVVFTSANGVRMFVEQLRSVGRDARWFAHSKIAVVGSATAAALEMFGLRPDRLPAGDFRAETLAAELAAEAKGKRFLLVQADRARETLAETLTQAGAEIERFTAYRHVDITVADPEIAARLAAGEIDWVTVTSSAIARSLRNLFGEALGNVRCASISPLTSETLRSLGCEPAAEAQAALMSELVNAIAAAERSFDADLEADA